MHDTKSTGTGFDQPLDQSKSPVSLTRDAVLEELVIQVLTVFEGDEYQQIILNNPEIAPLMRARIEWLRELPAQGPEQLHQEADNDSPRAMLWYVIYLLRQGDTELMLPYAERLMAMSGMAAQSQLAEQLAWQFKQLQQWELALVWHFTRLRLDDQYLSSHLGNEWLLEDTLNAISAEEGAPEIDTLANYPLLEQADLLAQRILEIQNQLPEQTRAVSLDQIELTAEFELLLDDGQWWKLQADSDH